MRDEDAICRNLKVKQGVFFTACEKRGYTVAGMAAAAEISEPTLRSYKPGTAREPSAMGLWALIKLAKAGIPTDLLSILIEDSDLSLTAIDPAAADWMRLAARTANFASKACAFQASDNHIDHREAAELREDMLIIISEGRGAVTGAG